MEPIRQRKNIEKNSLRKNVAEVFPNYYDVPKVFDNDRSVIMSGINFVERNESNRSFLNIF